MADDPWGALRGQAASGGFVFAEGIAGEAADLCADLMSILNVVKEIAGFTKPVPEFGDFDGAQRLRTKLDEVAGDFADDVMPKHREHITALGEAFVLAGKLYQETDQDAAGEFQRRVRASSAGGLVEDAFGHYDSTDGFVDDTYTKRPDLGNFSEEGNTYTLPAGLSGLKGSPGALAFSASVPPAEGLAYPDFYYLGIDLSGKPSQVEDKATYWYRTQVQMDTGITNFGEGMRGLFESGRWEGTGAGGARDAVNRYISAGEGLVTGMGQMAENLMHMAQWIMGTAVGMPSKLYATAISEEGENSIARYEAEAEAHYNAWYKPGVELTAGVLPKFLPPGETPAQPNDENNNGGNNGGGNGGGGGGGGGGGSTPAGLEQQQAALQGIEEQRAELMAAQQELETQAQQQQAALQQQQQALEQQPGAQPLLQAAQQGLQQLGQMGQQLSQAAQQALQQAGITGLPGMPALQDAVKNYQSALQKAGKLPSGLGGSSGAGAGGGGAPGGAKSPPVPNVEKAAKLFPRASLATSTGQLTGVSAAPAGQGMPMGGMPMGGGGAGGGAQGGQQKDHKRADYLDSTEWLEEGIGEPSIVAKPVVDQ
ncbi:hypothetical protein [Nocardia sp. NPDC024068]|uniref:hypothetical protein n=1 Tax=Nocardia sp. NPDC024068 TaxID=3157197 RepID=UPI00340E8F43